MPNVNAQMPKFIGVLKFEVEPCLGFALIVPDDWSEFSFVGFRNESHEQRQFDVNRFGLAIDHARSTMPALVGVLDLRISPLRLHKHIFRTMVHTGPTLCTLLEVYFDRHGASPSDSAKRPFCKDDFSHSNYYLLRIDPRS